MDVEDVARHFEDRAGLRALCGALDFPRTEEPGIVWPEEDERSALVLAQDGLVIIRETRLNVTRVGQPRAMRAKAHEVKFMPFSSVGNVTLEMTETARVALMGKSTEHAVVMNGLTLTVTDETGQANALVIHGYNTYSRDSDEQAEPGVATMYAVIREAASAGVSTSVAVREQD